MTLPRILTVIAAIVVSDAANAQSFTERFDTLDVNNDGEVTSTEALNAAWYDQLLARLDRNEDGVLQRSEVTRAAARRNSSQKADESHLSRPDEPPHRAIRNIAYDRVDGVDPNLLSFDLYVPVGNAPTEGRPVQIMIHGGGWRGGDKSNRSIVGSKRDHFVARGYIYASINYRLSPQVPDSDGVKHPTHAEDCARAIAHIHDIVAMYGGDPDRMHLMGHSAGAHLAGIVGTNERFLEAEGKDLSIIKTNVLLDTAAIDVPRYLDLLNGGGMTALYHLAFGTDHENHVDASPALHVEPGKSIPPTLLFYGGDRMTLDVIGLGFAEALTNAGSPSQAIDTVDLDHGQINSHVGMIGDPMTILIMRLHAGEDATSFPTILPGKSR